MGSVQDGSEDWLGLDICLRRGLINDPARLLTRLGNSSRLAATPPSASDLVALACQLYNMRLLRAKFITPSMLGEPVWDMLLALYCFSARGEKLSVSALCGSAGVPQTTALRWVQVMHQKNLLTRRPDARDKRRAFLALSTEGKALMDEYLATIHAGMAALR